MMSQGINMGAHAMAHPHTGGASPVQMDMQSMIAVAMQQYGVASVADLEAIALQMGMTLPAFLAAQQYAGVPMGMEQAAYGGMVYSQPMGYGGYDAYQMDPATAAQYSASDMQYADPAAAYYVPVPMGYAMPQPQSQAAPQLSPAAKTFVPPANYSAQS